ncbi:hypothetical protein TpMuguga_04g00582 [Theileria parva strain Muguga]|uniref:uncharacterized protein n=1 Tax=Theileria parva strain Muguga TaxID=333668 RepID=UPI001C6216AC|nr:uncharacterized protein TpMuguga_04g00582 [Theileria parva strain Muguga]EAN31934.2 hypothetical protein TpMuguga_04g00582 [Theileria parva strain Muguga]
MNDCTSYCKKAHSKFGNIKFFEANPTTTRHTAEDIGLTSCLQRCRLAEVIRPKDSSEIGKI